mgnify:CR=1 FL=1
MIIKESQMKFVLAKSTFTPTLNLSYAINLVQRGISLLKVAYMEMTDEITDVSLALEVISKAKG